MLDQAIAQFPKVGCQGRLIKFAGMALYNFRQNFAQPYLLLRRKYVREVAVGGCGGVHETSYSSAKLRPSRDHDHELLSLLPA